jgi:hypothetical protein
VPLVTRQASDRVLCVLGMNRPSVHGDAGLALAVGLIRSDVMPMMSFASHTQVR